MFYCVLIEEKIESAFIVNRFSHDASKLQGSAMPLFCGYNRAMIHRAVRGYI